MIQVIWFMEDWSLESRYYDLPIISNYYVLHESDDLDNNL